MCFILMSFSRFSGILIVALLWNSRIIQKIQWHQHSVFHLPEVRLHLGVREVRFYLGNPVRRKQKWVYFYKRVNESICGNIRCHSQSLLSGQGVRAVRPFREVPENRERGNNDEDVWGIMKMYEEFLVLTSHTGGPLGPGNPAGPCGPNEPCKTAQK